jgi:hypothetical protein
MSKKNILLVVCVALLVACGGKQKTGDDEPSGTSVLGQKDTGDSTDRSGNMIPPEKMDEVTQDLKRKQMTVSRCLSTAMEAGEVKKGTHGKVTFEIVIDTSGKVTNAKIAKSDIDNQGVLGCAKKHVEEIAFPQLPQQYETSFTFGMEAN